MHIQNFYSISTSSRILKNSLQLLDMSRTLTFQTEPTLVSADITTLYPKIPLDTAHTIR